MRKEGEPLSRSLSIIVSMQAALVLHSTSVSTVQCCEQPFRYRLQSP